MKRCRWCGTEFEPRRKNQVYCKSLCREADYSCITTFVQYRDDFKCVYCGDPATCVDHLVALCNGGTDKLKNIVAACQRCNTVKGSLPPVVVPNNEGLDPEKTPDDYKPYKFPSAQTRVFDKLRGTPRAPKLTKCKVCGAMFEKYKNQKYCSPPCKKEGAKRKFWKQVGRTPYW